MATNATPPSKPPHKTRTGGKTSQPASPSVKYNVGDGSAEQLGRQQGLRDSTYGNHSMSGELSHKQQLECGLYVVATPIGNLGDITFRAVDVLTQAKLIACEDTRIAGKLLKRFKISTPTISYNDHNGARVRPKLLSHLKEGKAVALISDAGTPLVSDPGYKLVRECISEDISIFPVPGASALLAGLVTAGLPTDRVMFVGFLPSKKKARQSSLRDLATVNATLVFYESGPRLAASVADMAELLGPRPAAVARELTKIYEEVCREPLDQLARSYAKAAAPKGELVVLVGAPEASIINANSDIENTLRDALKTMSVRDAVTEVAGLTGMPRRTLYSIAIMLLENRSTDAKS